MSYEQVVKYENRIYSGVHKIVENNSFTIDPREWYYITNLSVLKRKGQEFTIDNRLYRVCYKRYNTTVKCYDMIPSTLISEISSLDDLRELKMDSRQIRLFHSNYNIDFHNIPQVCSDLAENEFTKWDWDLVSKIKGDVKSCVWLKDLLNNKDICPTIAFFQLLCMFYTPPSLIYSHIHLCASKLYKNSTTNINKYETISSYLEKHRHLL